MRPQTRKKKSSCHDPLEKHDELLENITCYLCSQNAYSAEKPDEILLFEIELIPPCHIGRGGGGVFVIIDTMKLIIIMV